MKISFHDSDAAFRKMGLLLTMDCSYDSLIYTLNLFVGNRGFKIVLVTDIKCDWFWLINFNSKPPLLIHILAVFAGASWAYGMGSWDSGWGEYGKFYFHTEEQAKHFSWVLNAWGFTDFSVESTIPF